MTAAIKIFFKCLKSPIYYSVDDHASYFIGVNNYHQTGNALSSYDEMHQPVHTLPVMCWQNVSQTGGMKNKSLDLYHLLIPMVKIPMSGCLTV